MRFYSVFGALLLLSGCFGMNISSQTVRGSGDLGTRTEAASGIHDISLAVPGTLTIYTDGDSDLQIEGDDNIVDKIIVERRGDRLEIRAPRNMSFDTRRELRLTVGVDRLDAVNLAGSGRISVDDVRTDDFEANVAGSGTLVVSRLQARTASVNIAGSGDATLDGRVDNADVNIAGSGDANLADLDAVDVDVSIAGSGDAIVHASDRLSASIMGSGDVRYYGSPSIDRSVMGSGEVRSAD